MLKKETSELLELRRLSKEEKLSNKEMKAKIAEDRKDIEVKLEYISQETERLEDREKAVRVRERKAERELEKAAKMRKDMVDDI